MIDRNSFFVDKDIEAYVNKQIDVDFRMFFSVSTSADFIRFFSHVTRIRHLNVQTFSVHAVTREFVHVILEGKNVDGNWKGYSGVFTHNGIMVDISPRSYPDTERGSKDWLVENGFFICPSYVTRVSVRDVFPSLAE